MPIISERQRLLNSLFKLAKYYALFDDAEGFDDTIEMMYIVEKNRYLGDRKYVNLRKHLRMNGSIMDMMSTYNEGKFFQFLLDCEPLLQFFFGKPKLLPADIVQSLMGFSMLLF